MYGYYGPFSNKCLSVRVSPGLSFGDLMATAIYCRSIRKLSANHFICNIVNTSARSSGAFLVSCVSAQSAFHASAEVAAVRAYFYIGGGYSDNGNGSHIFKGQMYMEKQAPAYSVVAVPITATSIANNSDSIVLIHGQGQTGTNLLNKPAGHTVYIIDQTFRERSAWASCGGASATLTYSAKLIQQRFTAPVRYRLWPQAELHTQWPGMGIVGDPVIDAFYTSNIQLISNATYQQRKVQSASINLLDLIGSPVWLLGHSRGGLMPLLIADARPTVFGSSSARPWGLTDIPSSYSLPVADPLVDLVRPCVLQATSPAPRQLPNLSPLLILTVTEVLKAGIWPASYHTPYDYCKVVFLKQAGSGCEKASHLDLGKVEVHGNGRMIFMEKNSEEI
ncbi:alpha/beta-hydrolase [Macroventuria anomochaeta]|uniref:Alpha/beta-hydrolase n=1 Tax=Macroventuria anomochaeta TaxID=301207 RepID=A0ACB6S4T2_9PLEO|nr:alpha/beta-hydrolase [Macroventuria anomochaeta]KAF2629191.1 alpha/beta-hydrolase [Macroventuria anomochaeta]